MQVQDVYIRCQNKDVCQPRHHHDTVVSVPHRMIIAEGMADSFLQIMLSVEQSLVYTAENLDICLRSVFESLRV